MNVRAVARTVLARVSPSYGVISHVRTASPAFALTFDDGPDDVWTARLLDLLQSHEAQATFFLLGERIAGRENLVARMQSEGHCIATHSWDHRSLVNDPASHDAKWTCSQVERGASSLPSRPALFRAPFGHLDGRSRRAVHRAHLLAVGWNLDPRDYLGTTAEELGERVIAELRPGSIVLLHDRLHCGHDPAYFDRAPTIGTVQRVLEEVGGRMRCVTVPELLSAGRPVRRPPKSPPARWTPPPFIEDGIDATGSE